MAKVKITSTIKRLQPGKRREICLLAADWCEKNMGVNKKLGVPKVRVVCKTSTPFSGQYNPYAKQHEILVYYNYIYSVMEMIKVVIHEYTHSLQPVVEQYDDLYEKYGYEKHPMEKEAVRNEKLWAKCWASIQEKI